MVAHRHIHNLLWVFLFPLSYFWAAVTYLRRRFYPGSWRYRSELKVVCVGNVHFGGSGKTPLVLELCDHFKAMNPVILSRGYRGSLSKAGARLAVDNPKGPQLYGDEPWMLSRLAGRPVLIGKDRVRWVRELEAEGQNPLVIMDDGFQHLKLHRDVDLVAVNANRTIEDAFCLPWGELREPLSSLKSATAVVVVGGPGDSGQKNWADYLRAVFPEVPLFEVTRRPSGLWEGSEEYHPSPSDKLAGFCGIADPTGFRSDILSFSSATFLKSFEDHHTYVESDVRALLELKESRGASLMVTTDKDWSKALPLFSAIGQRLLSLRIRYDIPDEFWYFLDKHLESQ